MMIRSSFPRSEHTMTSAPDRKDNLTPRFTSAWHLRTMSESSFRTSISSCSTCRSPCFSR